MKSIFILIFTLVIFSCKEDTPETNFDEILVTLDKSVTKGINGSSWSVKLVEVEENSLCPSDVNCIWAGRIIVQVIINDNPFRLGAGDLSPKENETEIPDHLSIDQSRITIIEASELEDDPQWIKLKFEAL